MKRCVHVSSVTKWWATVAHHAPLSMGFSRQEYWSGLPFPPPRDLPYPGIKAASPALADGFFIPTCEVKVAQSCPTLCDPMDYTVRGILRARMLEWVAGPFSRGSSQPRDGLQVARIAGGFFTD